MLTTCPAPAKTPVIRDPKEVCDGDWDFLYDCLKDFLERMDEGVRKQIARGTL